MKIIDYIPEYSHEIADLFHASVHAIDGYYYSKQELEAWAPTPPDYCKWAERLKGKRPFIALQNSKVVGFIELEDDGHIDCLYTHKYFQRCGVAQSLYLYAEHEAKTRGIKRLYVEASYVARPFFEKQQFLIVKEKFVFRQGVALTNFIMEKRIDP